MYAPTSRWTICFLATSVVQCLVVLAIQSYIFYTFRVDFSQSRSVLLTRAIPTFLSLCIFGFWYQLLLVYDALRQQNTIQIVSLVVLNIGLLIYGVVQVDTLQDAVSALSEMGELDNQMWLTVKPFVIAIPCILAFSTVIMLFLAWKLWDEFAWALLRLVSADLKMRQRYLNYQVYLTLLKLGFFYYMGFLIQFVVIIGGRSAMEFGLMIACIPLILVTLIMANIFMKRETMAGMIVVVVLFFAGLVLFVFKLVRMYITEFEQAYLVARKELTTFSVITIITLLVNIVYACIGMSAFGKGLKPFVNKPLMDDDLDERHQNEGISSDGVNRSTGRVIEMASSFRTRLRGYQTAKNKGRCTP